ncbi:MAG: hypothetical protein ACE5FS_05285 [Paracoccaceae bacterium]
MKIEERLALALTRIRDAAASGQDNKDAEALAAQLDRSRAKSEALARELSELKSLRRREADELDKLIAQLSPLLGEAQNA